MTTEIIFQRVKPSFVVIVDTEPKQHNMKVCLLTTGEGESVNQFPGAVVNQTYGIENGKWFQSS